MQRTYEILIPFLLLIAFSTTSQAGKWKTGQGATIEDALLHAIDQLKHDSSINHIDSKSKSFKTTCTPNGPRYSVRVHGDRYGSGASPDSDWIEREAARLALSSKICPVSKNCRRSLRENIQSWHAGMIQAKDALEAIEKSCDATAQKED